MTNILGNLILHTCIQKRNRAERFARFLFELCKEDYASTNSVENTSPGVQLCTDFREGSYTYAYLYQLCAADWGIESVRVIHVPKASLLPSFCGRNRIYGYKFRKRNVGGNVDGT